MLWGYPCTEIKNRKKVVVQSNNINNLSIVNHINHKIFHIPQMFRWFAASIGRWFNPISWSGRKGKTRDPSNPG